MYETKRKTHATAPTTLIQLATSDNVSKCAGYNHSVLGHGRQHVRFAVSFWQRRPSGTRQSVALARFPSPVKWWVLGGWLKAWRKVHLQPSSEKLSTSRKGAMQAPRSSLSGSSADIVAVMWLIRKRKL